MPYVLLTWMYIAHGVGGGGLYVFKLGTVLGFSQSACYWFSLLPPPRKKIVIIIMLIKNRKNGGVASGSTLKHAPGSHSRSCLTWYFRCLRQTEAWIVLTPLREKLLSQTNGLLSPGTFHYFTFLGQIHEGETATFPDQTATIPDRGFR